MPLLSRGEAREVLRRYWRALASGRLRLIIAAAALAIAGLASTLISPPRPVLVWNVSPSAPTGLYLLSGGGLLRAGDSVVAWPPIDTRKLAAQRQYLPLNVPLVKQVLAVKGDQICAAGEAVFVNGRFAALRRQQDGAGRPLPSWTGCRSLKEEEIFLLMPGSADSFDGRYFGVTQASDVLGRARLVWPA